MSFRESRTQEEQKVEFLKRNNDFLLKLHEKSNAENLTTMVMSTEMLSHLYDLTDKIIGAIDGDLFSYKCDLERKSKRGVRILIDPYHVSNKIDFIYRGDENSIHFDIPCMCGSFNDEPHDVKLR